LINKLQPGSVPKVNEPIQNWHKQLENIGNFLRAITRYGVKPHDIFEANDLFENTNHTQVQSTLIALASQVTSLGGATGVLGDPQCPGGLQRLWRSSCPFGGHQMWVNKVTSVTKGRTERPLGGDGRDPSGSPTATNHPEPVAGLQAGMTAPGTKRQIFEPALGMEHCDTVTIGLQMGSNKGASQQGMTVYGLPRQVYDPKYCGGPELLGHDGYDGHDGHHGFYNSQ
ncbi:CNN1 protein, partial [Leptocoma aspasia]|nr:CNN1 protein [Leptocoma aspasia]